jgi:hypothetical protein
MAGSDAEARRVPAKPWHDLVLQPGKELKNYYKRSLGAGFSGGIYQESLGVFGASKSMFR